LCRRARWETSSRSDEHAPRRRSDLRRRGSPLLVRIGGGGRPLRRSVRGRRKGRPFRRFRNGSGGQAARLLPSAHVAGSDRNTHNRAGGRIFPQSDVLAIAKRARALELGLHLDGARLWNVCAANGSTLADSGGTLRYGERLLFEGLGAPVVRLSARARRRSRSPSVAQDARAGMRQSGILAAAALYAIHHHRNRLPDDHAHAKLFRARAPSLHNHGRSHGAGAGNEHRQRRPAGRHRAAGARARKDNGVLIGSILPTRFERFFTSTSAASKQSRARARSAARFERHATKSDAPIDGARPSCWASCSFTVALGCASGSGEGFLHLKDQGIARTRPGVTTRQRAPTSRRAAEQLGPATRRGIVPTRVRLLARALVARSTRRARKARREMPRASAGAGRASTSPIWKSTRETPRVGTSFSTKP